MKRNLTRLLSLAMCMMMTLSVMVFMPVSAADVNITAIDKHVVDFRSEEAFHKSAKQYDHKPSAAEPDPYTAGKIDFDSSKQAMRLYWSDNPAQTPIRLMAHMNENGGLFETYKYMVVVYQANTSGTYRFSVWNSPKAGGEGVIAENGTDTKGQFVISDPVNVSVLDTNGRSILKRWVSNSINTFNFKTDDRNAELYIKEVGFFKTPEDAKTYYTYADLSKPSATYNKAPSTIIPVDYTVYPDDNVQADGTAEPESTVEPVIWSFENRFKFLSLGKFTDHIDNTEGEYEFVKLDDGQGSLKLKYSPYNSFGAYRTMPAFHTKGSLTANHKYMRITYMTTDKIGSSITLYNNLTGLRTTLVNDAAALSKGEFVTTNPIRIDQDPGATTYLQRYINGIHCTIEYNSPLDNAQFYIKEVAFFGSEKQAYDYYGDSYHPDVIQYAAITFGESGTGSFTEGENFGNYTVNNETKTVDIVYAKETNFKNIYYMAKIKPNSVDVVSLSQDYIRVLYSAKNPEGVTDAGMYFRNDKLASECVQIVENIADTNGEFVLSDAIRLPADLMGRMSGEGAYNNVVHGSLFVNTKAEGGVYSIKAIYFFDSRAAAEAFEVQSDDHSVKIGGNDIAKYQIVIGKDYEDRMFQFADSIQNQIHVLTGTKLPIVTDDKAETDYEIIIGKTNRSGSDIIPADIDQSSQYSYKYFWFILDGNDLVFNSLEQPLIGDAIEMFNKYYLYKGASGIPEVIEFNADDSVCGSGNLINLFDKYEMPVNVKNPTRFTEDFDTDEGYFTEENGGDNWKIENGAVSTKAKGSDLTFIHVYEKNVKMGATLSYKNAGKTSNFGVMARYNDEFAYVKGGYDFETGEWYIESRDGYDFYIVRNGAVKGEVKENTPYELMLVTDNGVASLFVNGKAVLENIDVTIVSPGRVAIYAEDIEVTADNVDLTLVSGQGTIWRNVEHTILPVDSYIEGGTVTEMKDGSLLYLHQSDNAFKSTDNGKTWKKIPKTIATTGYVNMLRLDNGDLMLMKTAGGKVYSTTSSDDGKTWVDGGTVCVTPYPGTTAGAGNMNDKLMQTASGKLFYGMNYESTVMLDTGRRVFCEFYYSDDYGKTWIKSETDSWEIVGNEKEALFGECKLLECADGTIRMYNSWNQYGCLVYSESKDGGKTFGPLVKMEDFKSPHSSMQFVRDVYADNDTTYYMVWVDDHGAGNRRSALSLAVSYDGKEWIDLGDVWRWECTYSAGSPINHVVDPFVKVTEDYILCGSGFSRFIKKPGDGGPDVHQSQRQNIYAIRKDTMTVPENLGSFTDVKNTDTFYGAVKFAVDNGLFNGTSETTFEPYTTMNRAMFVTVLGRLDKADVSKYTVPTFKDVIAGQWYTSYVEWAAANGIVNGMGDGTYGINGAVTVEQALTILYRYADGKTGTATGKTLSDYTDSAKVSDWAKDAVIWAVANGIYDGAAGKLEPKTAASRALVAEMFANYVSNIK